MPRQNRIGLIAGQTGQGVVEITFGILFFYTTLMAIVEFSHLMYTKVNLQHAVSEAGRYMITGQGIDNTGKDPNARLKVVQNTFCDNLVATGLNCTTSTVSSHLSVTCIGGCAQPAGGPGQTVTLTATFTKPWFTGMFNYLLPGPLNLTARTTWKNETYK